MMRISIAGGMHGGLSALNSLATDPCIYVRRNYKESVGHSRDVMSRRLRVTWTSAQNEIERVRDKTRQLDMMGVPEEHLSGHAFHTYSLTSPDGSVFFSFTHNVCGRNIYAEGTVDAALFLAKKIQEGSDQKVFNMVDVLREGAMR